MKKFPLWITSIPIILAAATFQLTFDLGEQGKLDSNFFRETIYPISRSINGAMSNVKFRLRGKREPNQKIIIVEADESSINSLGRWPWHREVYAEIFHRIFQNGAKNLALDVSFSEAEERIPKEVYGLLNKSQTKLKETLESFEGDPIFAKVTRLHQDHLVLGFAYSGACQPKYAKEEDCPVRDPELTKNIEDQIGKFALSEEYPFPGETLWKTSLNNLIQVFSSIPLIRDSALYSGNFNIDPDSDGYIRRYPLFSFSGKKIYPSLALKIAELSRNDHVKIEFNPNDGLIRKVYFSLDPDHPIPVTPLGYLDLNFKGPSFSYTYIPAIDILAPINEEVKAKTHRLLDGADVFFGATAVGIYDMRAFPFDSNTPGVEGHATALDNLLANNEIRSASAINLKWLPVLLILIAGLSFAILFSRLESVPSIIIFVIFLLGFGLIDSKLLFAQNINIPTAFLLLETLLIFALILSIRYIQEERNKKFVREAFSKYLAPQVVDLVLEDPTKLTVGGERKDVTILFSDLRGFTHFSENMDPKTLTQFLNEYLSEMTEIVFQHEGTLDKYIGDAIMAFWGAPLEQPDHVERALKAAVAMRKRLTEIAPDFKKRYGIDVSAGIGINSGVVSVGNMGSKRIFEYTVIGDHVNLASRLESLTRLYACDILSTQLTKDKLATEAQAQFHTRTLDSVIVKGRTQAVDLIQISETAFDPIFISRFTEARSAFKMRDWDTATKLFQDANDIEFGISGNPDPVSEIYITRSREFKKNPPPSDWDGTIEMRRK